MKILVADDDPLVRAVVARVASQAAYDLVEAENGLVALDSVERDDPDVLITDLRMPVLDGFELVQTVRASARHRAMPIMCLSAVSDRDAITRLAEMGITDYILKPIRPRDLADRLQAVVTKYAEWKIARDEPVEATSFPAVLVIDPDVAFHAFVESTLAPDYSVLAAPTGATGVTMFRARNPRVSTVLIAEGLNLLDEQRVAALLRRLAAEDGMPAPTVLLVSSRDEVSSDKAAVFDGVVRRSDVATDFLAATTQWIPKSGDSVARPRRPTASGASDNAAAPATAA